MIKTCADVSPVSALAQNTAAVSPASAEAQKAQAQDCGQSWWQQAPPKLLAAAKFTSNLRQQLPVTDDQLRSMTPCEVVRNALPAELANTLLRVLLADAANWTRGTWFIGGKEHVAPRTSSYYALQDKQVYTTSLSQIVNFHQPFRCTPSLQSLSW